MGGNHRSPDGVDGPRRHRVADDVKHHSGFRSNLRQIKESSTITSIASFITAAATASSLSATWRAASCLAGRSNTLPLHSSHLDRHDRRRRRDHGRPFRVAKTTRLIKRSRDVSMERRNLLPERLSSLTAPGPVDVSEAAMMINRRLGLPLRKGAKSHPWLLCAETHICAASSDTQ